MFSGIIEEVGIVEEIESLEGILKLTIKSQFAGELKIDQSVSHNGVCLTVVEVEGGVYTVEVIPETLSKSNLSLIRKGNEVNLERSIRINERLDGHIVQGHVDQVLEILNIHEVGESKIFRISTTGIQIPGLIVNKGSIAINGVSLTISELRKEYFEVSIIPYTYQNTNFHSLSVGDYVNIEFDIIGKYVARLIGTQ